MKPASIILGYHGCDKSVAEAVLRDGDKLKASENNYDWLGHGIYFWENDSARAMKWAVEQKERGRIKEPFVIGAMISPKHCLDLTEQASLDYIADAYARLESVVKMGGGQMPKNKSAGKKDSDLLLRELDCAVINFLCVTQKQNALPDFDAVRGPFWEGDDLYPGARIKRKTHIQIAVREASAIVGYFMPNHSR